MRRVRLVMARAVISYFTALSCRPVLRRACPMSELALALTFPASRCASPRKNRLPKQYILDNQLAKLARLSDSSGKNEDRSGIVQINTARQLYGNTCKELTIPREQDSSAEDPECPIHALLASGALMSRGVHV